MVFSTEDQSTGYLTINPIFVTLTLSLLNKF